MGIGVFGCIKRNIRILILKQVIKHSQVTILLPLLTVVMASKVRATGKFATLGQGDYEIPSWAGVAPSGTHLNVMKGEKLVEKLIIDEKKCYVFGRNSDSCDFITEHSSCSRVHAILVYHKHLKRMFIIDLGSTHGSMVGNVRLEARKPTPIPFDSSIHFGASTRHYILKERPPAAAKEEVRMEEEQIKFGLPMEEDELDNLTEYNTAHNKRVTTIPVEEPPRMKRKRKSITFNEEEIIINPGLLTIACIPLTCHVVIHYSMQSTPNHTLAVT